MIGLQHTEFRVIGPPGTGKTTYLCRQAARAVEAWCERSGWHPSECNGVLISSLTKAAANELRARGLDLPADQIGTLHAHAWRALGRPKLCVDAKSLAAWNESCNARYRLSGGSSGTPDRDAPAGAGPGDDILAAYHVLRAQLQPREAWPLTVAAFADQYETWKRVSDCVDFSDVIHDAWASVDVAPGNPQVIFVDEAQDHDRAELRLVRKWAERCERVVIVGDPDQNLYEWRGSEPQAFYEVDIPDANRRVLSQSYRVPVAVHQAAMNMIGRVQNREPVEYQPRDYPGDVRILDDSFTGRGADEVVADAQHYIAAGKQVMFLAACEYMLRPLLAELREQGIPFWNPFAKDRGSFNPLHPSRGIPAKDRVLSYLMPSPDVHGTEARMWLASDLWKWIEVCDGHGWLRRGAKSEIEALATQANRPLTAAEVGEWMESDAVTQELAELSLDFFRRRLLKNRRSGIEFALDVFKKRGAKGLTDSPKVIVGTVHSVKGGEADVVYLAPDVSPAGFDMLDSRYPDPVYRLFYVGITRAKETLVLCGAKGHMAIEWE